MCSIVLDTTKRVVLCLCVVGFVFDRVTDVDKEKDSFVIRFRLQRVREMEVALEQKAKGVFYVFIIFLFLFSFVGFVLTVLTIICILCLLCGYFWKLPLLGITIDFHDKITT